MRGLSKHSSIELLTMRRQRSKRLSEGRKVAQQPTPLTQDEREQYESDHQGNDVTQKDEDELELDRLVLGDGAGFLAELDREEEEIHDKASEAELEAEIGLKDGEENLENVDDADVWGTFFLRGCYN
jgi:U3 small nucleolar RNA-associated protein 18